MGIPYKREYNITLHDLRVIYVIVPKVASTSMKIAMWGKIHSGNLDFPHRVEFPFVKWERIGGMKDYYRFGFVRNPWWRIVSCYESKIAMPGDSPVKKTLSELGKYKKGMSFREFVGIVCSTSDEMADSHFRSQSSFLCHNGSVNVDFVGRLSSIEEDFKTICENSALGKTFLPLANQTESRPYAEYYDEESISLVRERYIDDIERFGFDYNPDLKNQA
jgi:hypothetical protein